MSKKVGAAILAAGFGQINSGRPKVLVSFNHKRLIQYPLDAFKGLGINPVIVVNNQGTFGNQIVCALEPDYPDLPFAWQDGRRGPADAFYQALCPLRGDGCTEALVGFGDMPFISKSHARDLIFRHTQNEAHLSVSSWKFDPNHPLAHRMSGYAYCMDRTSGDGNINGFPFIRKYQGQPVEGSEVLSSLYVVNLAWFESVFEQLPEEDKNDGFPTERHLPNLVELAYIQRARVVNMRLTDDDVHEIVGVNTFEDWQELLAFANSHFNAHSGGRP